MRGGTERRIVESCVSVGVPGIRVDAQLTGSTHTPEATPDTRETHRPPPRFPRFPAAVVLLQFDQQHHALGVPDVLRLVLDGREMRWPPGGTSTSMG